MVLPLRYKLWNGSAELPMLYVSAAPGKILPVKLVLPVNSADTRVLLRKVCVELAPIVGQPPGVMLSWTTKTLLVVSTVTSARAPVKVAVCAAVPLLS